MHKLIFYSNTGPDRDDSAWLPFTLARRAIDASLEAEIVLSGAATGLVRREVRQRLDGRPKAALEMVLDAKIPIWLSPG